MFWQKELLRDSVSMAFAQTYELELPKSGLLGGLVCYIRSTAVSNAFLTAVKWRLIDYISKIEVIGDGAEVIKSYDGRQALASAFYDDFRLPSSMWRTYGETPQRQWIPINFGRGFLDELYGLDLSRFNQVTLKITNDASSDQFATDITISVVAYWMREAAGAFGGYFREEEWKTWLPVTAAWDYSQLPIALPIRRILLRGRAGVDADDAKNKCRFLELMDDIEFTFRSGQTRVYRGSGEVLGHLSVMEMPALVEARGSIDRTPNYGFETDVGYIHMSQGSAGASTLGVATYPPLYKNKDTQDSAIESGYRDGDGTLEWVAVGHGFGHCIPLYYARKPGLEDLLEPEPVKQVDVNIHSEVGGSRVFSGDTPSQNAIILSRLVR